MRGDHYDLSCFRCFEVSQASYTQDESITLLLISLCCGWSFSNPIAKVMNIQ